MTTRAAYGRNRLKRTASKPRNTTEQPAEAIAASIDLVFLSFI